MKMKNILLQFEELQEKAPKLIQEYLDSLPDDSDEDEDVCDFNSACEQVYGDGELMNLLETEEELDSIRAERRGNLVITYATYESGFCVLGQCYVAPEHPVATLDVIQASYEDLLNRVLNMPTEEPELYQAWLSEIAFHEHKEYSDSIPW